MSEATAHATGKRRRRMSGTGWLTLYAIAYVAFLYAPAL